MKSMVLSKKKTIKVIEVQPALQTFWSEKLGASRINARVAHVTDSFFLQFELRDSYDLNDVCDSRDAWAASNHSCIVIKAPATQEACHMW